MEVSPSPIDQPPDPKIEALSKSEKLLRKYQEDVWKGGYDVDWAPSTMGGGPIMCGASFKPVSQEYMDELLETKPDSYHACVQGPIEFSIDEINAETGSKYKLLDVVKVVAYSNLGGLYTFNAVNDSSGDDDCAVIQTLQAMVGFGRPKELHEWRFKGDKTPRGPKPKPIHSST